ncbi:uncharacterized protein LOC113782608 [Coffea eugenioides]|uniref:Uncharacterized protein n=1 Tax=Coffea arabica TaxID=13443 RepID=A0A6P6W0R5_COFAR|nr:uncharacterized protein LOC113728806 [Coffea arabica]XP_027157767.1 uncharacterized protein LOC113759394 [Coffea eugenioides]XP_027184287.1 uncharacterized protein LOC113782608 [Coffea eugenioides]
MEESREGDCRVPLISSIFCVCVTTGGVLLAMYVFMPSVSEPWFPIAAFILIGSPWIFWVFTYIYTCIKACCRHNGLNDRRLSRRRNATISNNAMARNESINDQPSAASAAAVNSPREGKHVQFGGVVVMDSENSNGHESHQDPSVASSKECEMPLHLGVSSS